MSVIDDYLAKIPLPERAELERIRKIAIQVATETEDTISYGMPVLKYKGKYLIGFNAWKDHLSIFPGAAPIAKLGDKLAPKYKLSKGTIRFELNNPIPKELIKEIVEIRLNEIIQK